jgi:hypothetical protein
VEGRGQLHAPAALLLGKELPVPIGYEAVGTRAGLDAVDKRNISCPCRKSNPDSSVVLPVADLNTDQGIQEVKVFENMEMCKISYERDTRGHNCGNSIVRRSSAGWSGLVE